MCQSSLSASSSGTYSVEEGNTTTIKVILSEDPERTVTIPITATDLGGATSADYSGVPASITIDAGHTEHSFTFTAAQDPVNDDGESVKLNFGALPSQVTSGPTDEATVTISDDDVPGVTVSFEQATYAVAEGGTTTIVITLSPDPERTVNIPITATEQGSATNADYSGVPASVTFDSGETQRSFTFTAIQDSVDDDGESVALNFGALPEAISEGMNSEATVTIADGRCTGGHRQLRVWDLRCGRGQHYYRQDHAQRRPGADRHHTDHCDRAKAVPPAPITQAFPPA